MEEGGGAGGDGGGRRYLTLTLTLTLTVTETNVNTRKFSRKDIRAVAASLLLSHGSGDPVWQDLAIAIELMGGVRIGENMDFATFHHLPTKMDHVLQVIIYNIFDYNVL